MEAGHGRPFTEADNEARRFVPLMRFRCIGFQPLDFIFGTDWVGMMVCDQTTFLTNFRN